MSQDYQRGSPRTDYDVPARGNAGTGPATGSDGLPDAPEGLGSLISGLIKDLQDLLRDEVRLAKVELKDDAKTLGGAAGTLAAGAVVGLVGLTVLMIGVAWLLDLWVDRWLGFGIVGLALLAVAGILVSVGKNRISAASLKPEQTIATLKEDQQWAKQQINSVKT